MLIRTFQPADVESVVALWERCGLTRPWNDPRKDIQRKLNEQPDGFLVAVDADRIVGAVMVGYEGHRGWISYLGVDPARQREGIGRGLLEEAERLLRARGCPKINLQVRAGNEAALAFYKSVGFALDDVLSFGKRLEHDR